MFRHFRSLALFVSVLLVSTLLVRAKRNAQDNPERGEYPAGS